MQGFKIYGNCMLHTIPVIFEVKTLRGFQATSNPRKITYGDVLIVLLSLIF